jgi:hypothetical protein
MAIPHADPGIPIDLRSAEEAFSEARTIALVKNNSFEAIRMVLPEARGLSQPPGRGRDHGPLPGRAGRVHRRRDDARGGARPDARPGRRGAPLAHRPGGLVGAGHEGPPRRLIRSLRQASPDWGKQREATESGAIRSCRRHEMALRGGGRCPLGPEEPDAPAEPVDPGDRVRREPHVVRRRGRRLQRGPRVLR